MRRLAHAAVRALSDLGARAIRPLALADARRDSFVRPALLDVTGCDVPDTHIFAPVLQVTRVATFDNAIAAANRTAYGLSAELVSDEALLRRYADRARAGELN